MGDQAAALQEAIQRARQLAASMAKQGTPAVKRTASDMLDDHRDIGTVKVTLAYEKPVNKDSNKERERSSSNNRDNSFYGRDSSRSRDRDRERDRDTKDDRDSSYLSGSNLSNFNNNNNINNNNPFPPRGASGNQSTNQNYGSMLSGHYSGGLADDRIEIIIPHAVIGLVIGKGGENIKRIQNETGATVRVDPNTVDEKGNKVCTITGTKQAVEDAHNQVSNVIENASTAKRPRMQMEGSDCYKMKIPASRTGAIIGKGGDTIKSIKQQSGCDIELDKNNKDCAPDESMFIIRGTQDKIMKAKSMIEARLASRGRGDGENSGRSRDSAPKGVATGANAAPVAQYTDLPASYPAAAQQNSADMSAAWAAYFAQYSTLFNQAGAQPGAGGLPYASQGLLGAGSQQVPAAADPALQHQAQAAQAQPGQQQDYTDQWIEFYLRNGRADYAEQIIEMKKQQQQQQAQKQQQPPQPSQ